MTQSLDPRGLGDIFREIFRPRSSERTVVLDAGQVKVARIHGYRILEGLVRHGDNLVVPAGIVIDGTQLSELYGVTILSSELLSEPDTPASDDGISQALRGAMLLGRWLHGETERWPVDPRAPKL